MTQEPATTTKIFHNATFLSMDEQDHEWEWLLVREGHIAALGVGEDWRELAGDDTDIIDLNRATVLPGFVEAHGHPTAQMAVLSPGVLDIRSSTRASGKEVIELLEDAIRQANPGDWVAAFGWDPLIHKDLPQISADYLSQLSPHIPLSVMHYSGHTSWANQVALEKLKITKETPDPAGSSYERDRDGNPTGKATEIPAAAVLMGPKMNADDNFSELLENCLEDLVQVGVTTTGDLAFDPDLENHVRSYYRSHHGPVRMRSYEISGAREPVARTSNTDPWFRQVGVKVWKDGSPWVGNIDVSFPYQNSAATVAAGVEPGSKGSSNYTHDDLLEICRRYYPVGWQIACHVHGDVAIDDVLDVFESVDAEYPREGYPKFRMEHLGAITREQVLRARELGVGLSFFPTHVYYYGEILEKLFGERASSWVPSGYCAEAEMPFSLHNDSPVTAENPLLNIQTAVTRLTKQGKVLGEKYTVPALQAVKAHTIYPAQQLLSEDEIGSLEEGKWADLVVLAENPLTVDPSTIGKICVLQTWLAGELKHSAQS